MNAKEVSLVVAFGDSYTSGYTSMGWNEAPYCRYLRTRPGERAVDYGLPGESSRSMVSRVDEVLDSIGSDARISLFIALGGTNDVANASEATKVVQHMQSVARKALGKADVVLLMTLPIFPNLVKYLPEAVEALRRINDGIRATAIDRVRIVDLCDHIPASDSSLWDRDGLHPSMQGYIKFAQVIQEQHPDLFLTDSE